MSFSGSQHSTRGPWPAIASMHACLESQPTPSCIPPRRVIRPRIYQHIALSLQRRHSRTTMFFFRGIGRTGMCSGSRVSPLRPGCGPSRGLRCTLQYREAATGVRNIYPMEPEPESEAAPTARAAFLTVSPPRPRHSIFLHSRAPSHASASHGTEPAVAHTASCSLPASIRAPSPMAAVDLSQHGLQATPLLVAARPPADDIHSFGFLEFETRWTALPGVTAIEVPSSLGLRSTQRRISIDEPFI